jgi:hypothetical protein
MVRKKPNDILSTEYPNDYLIWCILKALEKAFVFPSLSYEKENLTHYFKTAFETIMSKDVEVPGYDFLDKQDDIEELSKKAMEFFESTKTNIFNFAFLELLFISISSASAKSLKDNKEHNSTVDKFRVFPSQLEWIHEIHKKVLRGAVDLHKPGGDTTSKHPWDVKTCKDFLKTTNELKPLWEFILSFSRRKIGSADLLNLLKNEETYKTLSTGWNESFVKEVISRMIALQTKSGKRSYEKKALKRQQLTPLALACDHAAFELGIHPKDKPYSSATLLKYYQNINKGVDTHDNINPLIHEYILTFNKPPKN